MPCAPPLMPNMDKDVLFTGQLQKVGNSSKKFTKRNGNIRFRDLIEKYASEYASIVGKGQKQQRGKILTNMLRQLNDEGRKCFSQMGGVWAIMSDSCIRFEFSKGLSIRKPVNPVKSSETFVEEISTGSSWSGDSENQLFCWYNAQRVNIIHDRLLDYSEISKKIGRSEEACKMRLQKNLGFGIYKNEREILIGKLSSTEPDKKIPMNMRLDRLSISNDIPKKDLDRILEKGHCGFHIIQIPPKRLAKFSKEQFVNIKGNLDLSDD